MGLQEGYFKKAPAVKPGPSGGLRRKMEAPALKTGTGGRGFLLSGLGAVLITFLVRLNEWCRFARVYRNDSRQNGSAMLAFVVVVHQVWARWVRVNRRHGNGFPAFHTIHVSGL